MLMTALLLALCLTPIFGQSKFEECETGWTGIDDKCYFLSQEKADFSASVAKCQHLNGKLFEPKTVEQQKSVYDLTKAKGINEFYIGIYDSDIEGT